MSVIVGFTGTRLGLTDAQHGALYETLSDLGDFTFRHGDAIGADRQAHDIAKSLGAFIIVHPCNVKDQRANCKGDEELPPIPPLMRNRIIVRMSDMLIACPAQATEELRSGTWATIRYARTMGIEIKHIYPSGEVTSDLYGMK